MTDIRKSPSGPLVSVAAFLAALPGILFVAETNPSSGPSNGSVGAPYTTITEAVAAASNGDTILVAPGNYTSEATVSVTDKDLTIGGLSALGDSPQLPAFSYTSSGASHTLAFMSCVVGNVTASTNTSCIFTQSRFIASSVLDLAANLTWDEFSLRKAQGANVSLLNITSVTDLDEIPPIYGCGISGDTTISAGPTNVEQNQWNNVAITGTGQLQTRECVLRIAGMLDLSAAPQFAITGRANVGGGTSGVGGDAAGATGGKAGGAQNPRPWNFAAGSLTGTAGATATSGDGTAATAPTTVNSASGGGGGGTQASGAGSGKAGVAAQAAGTLSEQQQNYSTWNQLPVVGVFNTTIDVWQPGQSGRGGSAGGGDGTNAGGGGGGGGSSAHQVRIYAKYIKVSATTPNSVIVAHGSAGGNAAAGVAGNTGGGSGGGGGGGGELSIVYDYIIGFTTLTATTPLTADGGTGGNGGAGTGTGLGGGGGNGGTGGQILLTNRVRKTRTRVVGNAGTAGNAASGSSAGTGGAGGSCSSAFAA